MELKIAPFRYSVKTQDHCPEDLEINTHTHTHPHSGHFTTLSGLQSLLHRRVEGRQGTCREATPEVPGKDRERHTGKTRRLEAEGSASAAEPVDAVFSGTIPTWSQPVTCQEHKYICNFLLLAEKRAPHSSSAIPTYCLANRFL